MLKATQENGQANTVSGFIVDLTNVVSTPTNSELAIFTTDSTLSVIEAKVKSTTDTFTDLIKKNANVFSLAGLPPGVYTLDVIAQKQNSKAAYEGLVVIGQPVDEATKQTVQKEIVKQETDVNIVFEKPKQQPRKIVDKEGTCLSHRTTQYANQTPKVSVLKVGGQMRAANVFQCTRSVLQAIGEQMMMSQGHVFLYQNKYQS